MNACLKIPLCFRLTTGAAYQKVKQQVNEIAKCENTNK